MKNEMNMRTRVRMSIRMSMEMSMDMDIGRTEPELTHSGVIYLPYGCIGWMDIIVCTSTYVLDGNLSFLLSGIVLEFVSIQVFLNDLTRRRSMRRIRFEQWR